MNLYSSITAVLCTFIVCITVNSTVKELKPNIKVVEFNDTDLRLLIYKMHSDTKDLWECLDQTRNHLQNHLTTNKQMFPCVRNSSDEDLAPYPRYSRDNTNEKR